MDLKTALTLSVTIILALLGYLAKYLNDKKIAERKDRLDRVNRQLKELYGPLYSLTRASKIAWLGFRQKYRPGKESYWKSLPPPDKEEEAAWRLWMLEVFMPINLRLEKVIVENADLLVDEELPECLLEVCAHVAAYKTIIKNWEAKNFTEHASPIRFPSGMYDYTEEMYHRLKKEQASLLGKLQHETTEGPANNSFDRTRN